MKKMWGTRVLAMLLVLALTAGLVPAALAANSEVSVAFKQVPNDTLDTLIRPDLAVGGIENAEMGEDTAAYQAHDLVRVSIILEDTSTLEAYSDAAAEGTLPCLTAQHSSASRTALSGKSRPRSSDGRIWMLSGI
mgnify:CR=1 FL=1